MSSKNTSFIQVEGYNIRPNQESGAELDDVILNIIRVNSQKPGVLSAFLARRKCYKICKKVTGRVDYKEYVQRLLLDNYPAEFKKAEYGQRLLIILCVTIPFLIIGAILLGVGIDYLSSYFSDTSRSWQKREGLSLIVSYLLQCLLL